MPPKSAGAAPEGWRSPDAHAQTYGYDARIESHYRFTHRIASLWVVACHAEVNTLAPKVMDCLRHPFYRKWVTLVVAVFTWMGSLGASVDAVRYVHEYCSEHQALEHREADESDRTSTTDDPHQPCVVVGMPAAEPPALPVLAAPRMVEQDLPTLPAPPVGGGARAPPLTYAPKTSPPAIA